MPKFFTSDPAHNSRTHSRVRAKTASPKGAHSPKSKAAHSPKDTHTATFTPFTDAERSARQASLPSPITYPPELPVSAEKEKIAAAIQAHQVVIIAGETGSGKTTQLPKICLEIKRGIAGIIGHTQPRRIAARSVAERISSELGSKLGEIIGYQVRFTEITSRNTLVKLMTDGILLAEIQSDPLLKKYDTIIIDEAHERSLNIDFLLGYLTQLLPKRPDLKLIITSATIDSQRFAQHFAKHTDQTEVPVIEVSGRTYPVEIRYRPLAGSSATAPHTPPATATTSPENSARTQLTASENRTNFPPATSADTDAQTDADPQDQISAILAAAHELTQEGPGDILVFLSGEGEIRETQKAFQDELGERYISPGGTSKIPGAIEVLPLFARLTAAEQHRIFTPHQQRRIILATNIAETSLTVPGIRYVIDPGTARISRYSNKTKVQRLPIEPISQASANQRAGRCGRIADGIAIRLYAETDFAARPEFTEPEIQRTSLAAVILQMAALNLGTLTDFPFLDPPDFRAVRAGEQLLHEIGALENSGRGLKLTKIGRKLARLPIDPRLGRMLLAAHEFGCAAEVLVLVAAMSVQDVRERPLEFQAPADQLHARFIDHDSDFLAYLHLWRYLRTQQRELSGTAFRKMCRAEYLHWLRFREWEDVVTQLRQLAKPLGIKLNPIKIPNAQQLRTASDRLTANGADLSQNRDVVAAVKELSRANETPAADAIHQALLTGMLSNLGNWDERKRDYAGARGTHFIIWPGSGLYKRTPAWVMAAELVETSRLFARTVARINSDWIEQAGAHLLKYQYSEPYWSTRNGAAMVHEKVSLHGMTVVADRKVLLTKVGTTAAKELARELFIRHALVENQWRAHHKFIKHNLQQLEKAQAVEAKMRQYGLVADENELFEFFDERISEDIVSSRHFDTWWKKEQRRNPQLLNFTQEFLLGETNFTATDFPTSWRQGEIELPIHYDFQPGKHSDGLRIEVPVTLLPQLRDVGFDWLVPGMLPELVQATIRALPKTLRRQLVPAPDMARKILPLLPAREVATGAVQDTTMLETTTDTARETTADSAQQTDGSQSFFAAFTAAVKQLVGMEIPEAVWEKVVLPAHLEITFVVRSERGAVLEEGPSLTKLQRDLAAQSSTAVENVVKGAVGQALEAARAKLLAATAAQEATSATHLASNTRENSAADGANNAAHTATYGKGQDSHAAAAMKNFAANFSADCGEDLQTWPLPADTALPEMVESTAANGMVVRGYPAFVEVYETAAAYETRATLAQHTQLHKNDAAAAQNVGQTQSRNTLAPVKVALRVLSDPALQVREHRAGIIRLLTKELSLPEGRITSRWNGSESLLLASAPYPNTSALVEDLHLAAVRNIAKKWAKINKSPLGRLRNTAHYTQLRKYLKDRLEDEIYRIAQICTRICSALSEVNAAMHTKAAQSPAMVNTVKDVRTQIKELFADGFLYRTPDSALIDLLRYLQAAQYRLEKAPENLAADATHAETIADMEDLLFEEVAAFATEKYDAKRAADLEQAKWLIQELRVSLFAQPLGTKVKVSPQRIKKLLLG